MTDSNRNWSAAPGRRLQRLIEEVQGCRLCAPHLPLGPRPVFAVGAHARLLIVGQAPGIRVHETGVPWNDRSGDRLRQWLGLSRELFYDTRSVALLPMGLCYPGSGPRGDLPPRPECARRWAHSLRASMPEITLTVLAGRYAQAYYLGARAHRSLTRNVRAWRSYWPEYLPLPHPSGRNNIWLKANPWFAQTLLPDIQPRIRRLLSGTDDAAAP